MDTGELDNAKLGLALAHNDERLLAWAKKYGEDLVRTVEELLPLQTAADDD